MKSIFSALLGVFKQRYHREGKATIRHFHSRAQLYDQNAVAPISFSVAVFLFSEHQEIETSEINWKVNENNFQRFLSLPILRSVIEFIHTRTIRNQNFLVPQL